MKKLLAISFAAASIAAVNAQNVSISSNITGVNDADGIIGTAGGFYDNAGKVIDINGTINGADANLNGTLPLSVTGFVEGPSAFKTALSINSNDTFYAAFDLSNFNVSSGFPTGFYLKFYNGSTLIASGPIVLGSLSTPEPQTYAMAAGAALLGFAAFRRARR